MLLPSPYNESLAQNVGGLMSSFPVAKRERIYERDNFQCVYCGENDVALLTLDHVAPISKGGDHHDDNLVTACRACNNDKADLTTWIAPNNRKVILHIHPCPTCGSIAWNHALCRGCRRREEKLRIPSTFYPGMTFTLAEAWPVSPKPIRRRKRSKKKRARAGRISTCRVCFMAPASENGPCPECARKWLAARRSIAS